MNVLQWGRRWLPVAIVFCLAASATGARAQEIEFQNPDGLPYPDGIAFSRIGKLTSPPAPPERRP